MTWTFCITIALMLGFLADLAFGEHFAAICPAILLGKLIAHLERALYGAADNATAGSKHGSGAGAEGSHNGSAASNNTPTPNNPTPRSAASNTPALSPQALRRRGRVLVLIVCLVALAPTLVLSVLAWVVHPILFLALQAFWFYQIMATRCLKDASLPVYQALEQGNLDKARHDVGMIVGRDTTNLTAEECTKAAVETVAENTSDGSIAPLFFFALGGAPLAMMYKGINTMDSMIGYKSDRYLNFGRCAALLDDVANFIPARITGLLFVAASLFIPGCSAPHAARVWARDRKKSTSPNSGQCESAVAGALGVTLLGDATYFGTIVHKESVGDATRAIIPEDIKTSHALMFTAASFACIIAVVARLLVFGVPWFV